MQPDSVIHLNRAEVTWTMEACQKALVAFVALQDAGFDRRGPDSPFTLVQQLTRAVEVCQEALGRESSHAGQAIAD